jgi:geranylgeranyl pyrophosphate synthase
MGGSAQTETERIAREWLARDGKRWRPLLTACAYKACSQHPEATMPDGVRKLALAVECFHKASLIHDDIEDDDAERYGQQTVHAQHGVPIALNVGDLLLGEGYRLLVESGTSPNAMVQMMRIAAEGHRSLCLGQGTELSWARNQRPMSAPEVLDIFRQKTAPAFEVALRLGAAYAGAGDDVHAVLTQYSEALGIAYQIRDDLEDLSTESAAGRQPKPTLPLAEACDRARGEDKALLQRLWCSADLSAVHAEQIREVLDRLNTEQRCRQQLESWKEAAVQSLTDLRNPSLKGLLRRVIAKIFRVEIQGWCSEFEARNAAGSATVTHGAE